MFQQNADKSNTPDIVCPLYVKRHRIPGIGLIEGLQAIDICIGMNNFRMYVKDTRTKTADAFIKMVMSLCRAHSGKDYHLPVIRAARLCTQFLIIGMGLTVMVMTASAWSLDMIRMYILTIRSAYYSGYENLPASAAGMHIKAYDTQRVPYYHQNCRQACEHILHTNLQR